jgi:hypothetical protein
MGNENDAGRILFSSEKQECWEVENRSIRHFVGMSWA